MVKLFEPARSVSTSGDTQSSVDPDNDRLEETLRRHDRNSEKAIALGQALISGFVLQLHLLAQFQNGWQSINFWVVAALATLIFTSVLRFRLADKNVLSDWTSDALNVFDILIFLALIWSYQFAYDHPAGGVLKSPSFTLMFALVALRALRFHPRPITITGSTAVLGLCLMVLFSVLKDGQSAVTNDYAEYLVSHAILIGAEVERVVAAVALTLFLALATHMARRQLLAAAQAADHAKKFASALQESTVLFSRAFQACPVPLAITDPADGTFLDVNEAWLSTLGYRKDEVVGQSALDLGIWVNPSERAELIDRLKTGKSVRDFEAVFRARDGKKLDFLHAAELVEIQNTQRMLTASLDITQRKKTETLLQRQAATMTLFNTLAMAANRSSDAEEVFGYCIAHICEFTGWEVGHAYLPDPNDPEVLRPAKSWYSTDKDKHASLIESTAAEVSAVGKGLVGRARELGQPYWRDDLTADPSFARAEALKASGLKGGVAFPVRVGGDVGAVLEFFSRDPMRPSADRIDILNHAATQLSQVLERQVNQQILSNQNERFDAALQNISQGLCMFDSEQRLIVCNERYEKMYNLPPELATSGVSLREIIDHRIAQGIYGNGSPEAYIRDHVAWATDEQEDAKILDLSDGRSIEIKRQPLSGGGWVATHEDVTEIRNALQLVRRQKEELDQILLNVPRAVITTDQDGIIKTFNPAAELTFGYEASEAVGQDVSMLMPEPERGRHGSYIRSYIETGVSKLIDVGPRRLTAQRKDGTEFPIELSLAVVGEGESRGFLGVLKDITDQINAENELIEHRDTLQGEVDRATVELKAKAIELERALAKEKELNEMQRQFVATASHEFRTPLTIIDMTVQRMMRSRDRATAEDFEKRTKKIRAAVKTMTALMESTLSAARMDAGKAEINVAECDVLGVVLEVCVNQLELNENNKIVCDLKDLPSRIRGDRQALEQVFTNLLSNAIKYSPDGPDITVTGWQEGDEAVIAVEDRGLGIDEDDLPKMFTRFHRAKTSAGISGTGIGLALVRTLVELHGGSIGLVSKKGEGSTFTVRLPIDGPPAQKDEKIHEQSAA